MKKMKIISFILSSFSCCISFAQLRYNVDVMPANIGGNSELKRIFRQEVRYPISSLEKKEGGKVKIDFVVRQDSSITDIHIVEAVSPLVDTEALRIFKLIQWLPAMKDQKAVACNWSTTFNFDPVKYAKICKERGYTNFPYLSEADTSGRIEKSPQQLPLYPQGMFAIQEFIKTNMEYPHQAQVANIQGKVVLRFVVEPSGLMTNIGVKHSVGGGCDEEAIRVLQLIKWSPGIKNKRLVRVQMTYPFYFVLNDEFKDNSLGEQK